MAGLGLPPRSDELRDPTNVGFAAILVTACLLPMRDVEVRQVP